MNRERILKVREVLKLALQESLNEQMGYADMYDYDDSAKKFIDESCIESNLYPSLIKELDIVLGDREPDERLTLDTDSGGTSMGVKTPQHKLHVRFKP